MLGPYGKGGISLSDYRPHVRRYIIVWRYARGKEKNVSLSYIHH